MQEDVRTGISRPQSSIYIFMWRKVFWSYNWLLGYSYSFVQRYYSNVGDEKSGFRVRMIIDCNVTERSSQLCNHASMLHVCWDTCSTVLKCVIYSFFHRLVAWSAPYKFHFANIYSWFIGVAVASKRAMCTTALVGPKR